MDIELIRRIAHFQSVKIPRYIIGKIQDCALKHLNVKDMGKLRDRMEGQTYYERLMNDIIAEYAFENIIGLPNFDWEKRMVKSYKRKVYSFGNEQLNLINFCDNALPRFEKNEVDNGVFVFVNPDSKVLVSGLATRAELSAYARDKMKGMAEFSNFEQLTPFSSVEELTALIGKSTCKDG